MSSSGAFLRAAIAVILAGGSTASVEGSWQAAFVRQKAQWLPGEPVAVRLVLTNGGNEAIQFCSGTFHLDLAPEACRGSSQDVVYPPPPPPPGTEGEEHEAAWYPPGAVREFEVRVTRECNLELGLAETHIGHHRFCYRDCDGAEMACAEFDIVQPDEIDAEALALLPPTLRDVVTDRSVVPTELLTRFGASTYAGYSLGLGGGFSVAMDARPDYILNELWEKDYVKEHPIASYTATTWVADGSTRETRERVPMLDYLLAQRARVDEFLALHPGFAEREMLELARGMHSLALKELERARASFTWVQQHAWRTSRREQAEAILKLLPDAAGARTRPSTDGREP